MSESDLKFENDLANVLRNYLGDEVKDIQIQRRHRVWAEIPVSKLRDTLQYLMENRGLYYLSTISGVDMKDHFELLYHLFLHESKIELTLTVKLPHDNPSVPTIVDLFPGADMAEREAHEMFGILIKGRDELKHVELPDNWPEGQYPLRKDWKPDNEEA